jgi:lipooligosaccharide transport system permease protein
VNAFVPVLHWQSWAVLGRHVRVHLRKWHTALLPPFVEPVVLLAAFGVGLGRHMEGIAWSGRTLSYLAYLAPGMLAYTAFMTAFFQSLFTAYIRMRFQKSWEGQLTTQVRLEHVVWGEALWAAAMATTYAAMVGLVLLALGGTGRLALHWAWLPAALPLLFLAALAFASVGLLFTALLPTMDHMSLPFFLVILPIAFASNTYFPMPPMAALDLISEANPLRQLADGLRELLLDGRPTWRLGAAAGLFLVMLAALIPLDLRLLRRRVLGEG